MIIYHWHDITSKHISPIPAQWVVRAQAGGWCHCVLMKGPRLLAAVLSPACCKVFLGIDIQPLPEKRAERLVCGHFSWARTGSGKWHFCSLKVFFKKWSGEGGLEEGGQKVQTSS